MTGETGAGNREGARDAVTSPSPSLLTSDTSFSLNRVTSNMLANPRADSPIQEPQQPILLPLASASIPIHRPSSRASSETASSLSWLDLAVSSSPIPRSSSPSLSSLSSSTLDSDISDFEDSSTSASCDSPLCCPPSATSAKALPQAIPAEAFSSLLVVGAGPHALALCARLAEPHPAALYTEAEHARLSWLRQGRNKLASVRASSGRRLAPPRPQPRPQGLAGVQVLDSTSSDWAGRWHAFFEKLELRHLRSPMLFHPDPSDADALVGFARKEGREEELLEIRGVVGREGREKEKKR